MLSETKYYIFIIIKVVAFAASFLREAGVRLHRPIGFALTEVSGIDILLRKLPVFQYEVLSTNMDISSFHNKLRQAHDDAVLIHYIKGEKCNCNLVSLFEATLTGMIDGSPFCAVPIVIFDGFIPDEIVEELSLILEFDFCHILTSNVSDEEVEDDYFESLAQNICRNQDAFKKAILGSWKNTDDLTEERKVLLGGRAIIDLDMDLRGVPEARKNSIHRELDQAINAALDFSESYLAKEQIAEKFITCLRTLITAKGYSLIHMDQCIEGVNYILYDAQTYYIPSHIFNEVCELVNFTSSVRIKRCLCEQGILKTEGQARSYYSRKIYGKGLDGKRFFWIDRSKVDREIDLNLTEI